MIKEVSNPDTFRENIINKLSIILCVDTNDITKQIESAIYEYADKECKSKNYVVNWNNKYFIDIYIDRLRSVTINMSHNEHIKKILIERKLNPRDYVFMSHQEINPERWKQLIKEKTIRDENKFNNNQEASTDLFTCPRSTCKSKRCTYYEMQTRSADEPMTIFVTCLDCGKNFKRS
jgi:DNA-directed RNA polymerase subunit M/transcription elongation factor TFIIS